MAVLKQVKKAISDAARRAEPRRFAAERPLAQHAAAPAAMLAMLARRKSPGWGLVYGVEYPRHARASARVLDRIDSGHRMPLSRSR
jgi:hypothetical protein